jgi:DNA polymerase-3 subunit alpha
MCSSNKDFVHLHAHTHFSVQDALPTPKKYAMKAREMGFLATAITDHGKLGGAVEFVESCRMQCEYDPIKPIVGIEVYTCQDRFDRSKTEDGRIFCHFLLLVMIQKLFIILLALIGNAYKNILKALLLCQDV